MKYLTHAAVEVFVSHTPRVQTSSNRMRAVVEKLANNPISVATTTWDPAGFDSAPLTTANRLSEVLQEQRVHCALEAHMQFANLALGQCEEADKRSRWLRGQDLFKDVP